MRAAVVLALAGCGRFGFGPGEGVADASPDTMVDAPADGAVDAAVIPGLVASWAMDEDPRDGTIDDGVGLYPARCIVGVTCPTQTAGQRGSALQFDGTTQLARIPSSPAFMLPSGFTIAVWVKVDDLGVDRVAVAKPHGNGSDDSWGFVTWTNDTCLETTMATAREDACGGFATPVGTWTHFSGTWDGTSKRLYVNGVQAGQFVSSQQVVFDAHDIVIGADENDGQPAYRWKGAIDELHIFDRALSSEEILEVAGL